jgi:hypothetical protein
VSLPINARDRAAQSLREAPRPQNPAMTIGVKLIGLALLNLFIQVMLLESGQFVFYENPEFSRSVHVFFVGVDDLTPALRRLREYYWQPIDGVEFSQAFSVYLTLLASQGSYIVLLGALALKGRFNNVNWRVWTRRDFSLMAALGGAGVGVFLVLFSGPPSMGDRFRFGGSFISSFCFYVPLAQFFILLVLTIYFTMGVSLRMKPNNRPPQD